VNKYKFIFGMSSKLFILPLHITESVNILKSEHQPSTKSAKSLYLKIEFFQRDFTDEFNLKALKQKKFYSFEIWNMIYMLIFALAAIEEKSFPLIPISLDDLLVVNNSYKYYYKPMFSEFFSVGEQEGTCYGDIRLNIMHLMLVMMKEPVYGELQEFDSLVQGEQFFLDEIEKIKHQIDEKVFVFAQSILIRNEKGYSKMSDVRSHLCGIYEQMEFEVIEDRIIKDFSSHQKPM
jgi:hypothetical protein